MARTIDRSLFHTVEKLGLKRQMTKEGYLICYDVPIARTGVMQYGPEEMPQDAVHARNVPAGRLVQVIRSPEEVFRPDTIASANGKAVVNEHPEDDVTPLNHRDLAVGHMQDPRRGSGQDDDLLLADAVITDPDTIRDILSGKIEVSCGYDADYFDDEARPGWAEQRNILINHLALVHEGRCGPRCSISDHAKEQAMSRSDRSAWGRFLDRIRSAAKDEDMSKLEEALKDELPEAAEPSDAHTHIHIHGREGGEGVTNSDDIEGGDTKVQDDPMMQKLNEICELLKGLVGGGDTEDKKRARDEEEKKKLEEDARRARDEGVNTEGKKIEGSLETEAPPGTGDRARKARDSTYLVDAFQRTAATAEILAPGIRLPTFDAKLPVVEGYKTVCDLRRSALDLGYARSDTRDLIEQANGGRAIDLRQMTCDAVRSVFMAAGAMKKADNNRRHFDASGASGSGTGVVGRIRTPAELNKANTELWNQKEKI